MESSAKIGLLERLKAGVVIGDGGFVHELEQRGYVQSGSWTPEVNLEYPDAVRQLHRDYLRAGSDVMQTFTFNLTKHHVKQKAKAEAGCAMAREVADEGGALVAGSLSATTLYVEKQSKHNVQELFRSLLEIFLKEKVDFLICEFFDYIEEMEWAIEVCCESDMPICATMNIGVAGDKSGVPTAECAVRMASAGAHVVGRNCTFDMDTSLKTMEIMKEALETAGLHPYLMCQPPIYHCPDADPIYGVVSLPEFPLAMEPRNATRIEVHQFARQAYDMGIRYIGGCCGFAPYHIRAIAEELAEVRGRRPQASDKSDDWGKHLINATWSILLYPAKTERAYWEALTPATGRPYSPALARRNKITDK